MNRLTPTGLVASLASFLVVLGALAVPWLRHAAEAAPAGAMVTPVDQYLVVWVLGWVAHVLTTDPRGLFDANINHPAPGQLTGIEHFLSTQVVFGPVFGLTGNAVLATNAAALVSYPLAALAMQRLLLALECGPAVAWVGGFAFALGPERVPGNLLVLKYPNLYLPAVALCLTRLRERPTARRALVLAAATALGALASYYLAVMIAVAGGVWGAFELTRPAPARRRFAALALAALAAAALVVAAVSVPYFLRPDAAAAPRPADTPFGVMLWNLQAVGHTRLAGGVALVLAALGAPAIFARTPAVRRLAVRGLALTVLAQALMVGRAYLVHGVAVPMPLALLAASPLRFFRYPFRFVVVLGFGATLLGAAVLEAVRRRLGRGAGAAAAAAVAFAVLATRGPALVQGGFEDFAVQRNPVYGAVGETARTDGAGPLLELPVIGFMQDARHAGVGTEAESMVGSTRHWLPLVVGYTDFPPPHRRFLDRTLRRLPASEALDLVVDMTGLRWVLLRPEEEWPPRQRALRRGLLAASGVRRVWSRDRWDLLRVERAPRHPEWAAAIARGWRPGSTVLGTPLEPLGPEGAAVVSAHAAPAEVHAGAPLRLTLTVTNRGARPWPVVAVPGAPPTHTVRLEARWRAADAPADTTPTPIELPHDVAAGESVALAAWLGAPAVAGAYDLDVAAHQVDDPPFTGGGNAPLRTRVAVTPAR